MPDDTYQPLSSPEDVSTLRHYLNAVWRRKWVLVTTVVVITLATLLLSLRQDALYEASADVLVNRQEVATTSLIGQTPALDDAQRTLETQSSLARVPIVEDRTLANFEGVLPEDYDLFGHSSVFPVADLLRFRVSDGDGSVAERLAGAYARAFVAYRRQLDTAGLARTLQELRSQMSELEGAGKTASPLYVRLADREQQLESLKALRSSNVSVVRVPESGDAEQVAPRPRRDIAVALAASLVIGLILVFLWESLSTKPRGAREIEALLGMPLLGRLALGARSAAVSARGDSGLNLDEVHTLRTNIELAEPPTGVRSVMITSPRWGEGKSEMILELAGAFSRSGRSVVVVDLDLRRSELTKLLGLSDQPGIAGIARGACSLGDARVQVSADPRPSEVSQLRSTALGNGGSEPGPGAALDFIAAGSDEHHPTEVLSSGPVAAALDELRGQADILLVDVPPLLEAPDAAAIAPQMDALLLVVDADRARTPVLADVRRALDAWPTAKLGFALTVGTAGRAAHGRWAQPVAVPERASEPERVA